MPMPSVWRHPQYLQGRRAFEDRIVQRRDIALLTARLASRLRSEFQSSSSGPFTGASGPRPQHKRFVKASHPPIATARDLSFVHGLRPRKAGELPPPPTLSKDTTRELERSPHEAHALPPGSNDSLRGPKPSLCLIGRTLRPSGKRLVLGADAG